MANVAIVNRVRSLVASDPFSLLESREPFDFERVPTTAIDGAVRVVGQLVDATPGMSFSEERFDEISIWVARMVAGDPYGTTNSLHVLCSSLVSAVIRDGVGEGDYAVLEESVQIAPVPDSNYYIGRVALRASYVTEV